ncbi:MAG: AHH domain-containing protein [Clostridia bacterium]|nr:AHH domain-containing protein [Clostridia bacterium]
MLYSAEINEDGETIETLGGIMYTKGENTTSGDIEKGTSTLTSNTTSSNNSYDFVSENDYFGRQTKRELSKVISNTDNVKESLNFQTSYNYKSYSGNRTSSLISSYRAVLNRTREIQADETNTTQTQTLYDWEYLYTYDANGNIVDLSVNIPDDNYGLENVSVCSYIYDEAGQLVRENNAYTEKSYVYVYDKGGNITQKIEYEYSEDALAEPLSTVNYTYDSTWKDKLTDYGDTAITTDEMGNPLNHTSIDYLGNKVDATLEWNGRQLSAVIINGQRTEYTYDSNGMRTKMTVYNTDSNTVNAVYYYVWDNDKLLGYIVTNANGVTEHTVKMLFDNTNDSVGYELYSAADNTTKSYFFLKNLQGDITNVFNENGADILQYAYDAWGNVTAIFDKSSYEEFVESAEAAVFTPITYRGYMYDQYSGLYYLQSRYYNPTYGRFLNADDTSILKQTAGEIHGANLFAYCNNAPIHLIDPTGRTGEGVLPNESEEFTIADGIILILLVGALLILLYSIVTLFVNLILPWIKNALIEIVSEIRHKLGIDVPKTLTEQMERAKVKADNRGRNDKTVKHHIVAKNDRRAEDSRIILHNHGLSEHSPQNIVTMNKTVHWYLHTTLYHYAVKDYLSNAEKSVSDDSAKDAAVLVALLTLKAELAIL